LEPCQPEAALGPHVYILDTCPARRRGLEVALSDAGCLVDTVFDVDGFAPNETGVAVIDAVEKTGLDDLQRIHASARDLPLVALVSVASPQSCCDALALGATSVVPYDTLLEDLVVIVLGAARGWTVMPAMATPALVSVRRPVLPVAKVDEADGPWLRLLVEGATVSEMGRQLGYSEREVHRRLRVLYRKLGVDGRIPAIVAAVRQGLVD
jgi:DNA-binding NarL/FixJ family response regulator